MTKRIITRENLHEARILVVEDEPTLAYALEESLLEAGFQIAGVAGRLAKALAIVELGDCDGAVVDANLAGVSAAPVAAALVARAIPFIVVSGYSLEQQQCAFPGGRLLQKPCRPEVLVQAVRDLFAANASARVDGRRGA